MPIKLNSTGGGSVTIDVPSMSTANTLTLPAITGNVITSSDSNTVTQTMINRSSFYGGFGPAFEAYLSGSTQALTTSATWYKVTLNAESYDTASCFDSTTNYRFTPNIAGYYHITAQGYIDYSTTSPIRMRLSVYKNGVGFKETIVTQPSAIYGTLNMSNLIYMNGSSDYLELYSLQQGGSGAYLIAGAAYTYMSGFLARPA